MRRVLCIVALLGACDLSDPIPLRFDAAAACEQLEDVSLWVDSTCTQGHCDARYTQEQCEATIDLMGPCAARLAGPVDGVLSGGDLSCRRGPLRPDAVLSLVCGDCTMDFYSQLRPPANPDIRHLQLHSPPEQFYSPRTRPGRAVFGSFDHGYGWAAGLVRAGARMVAGSREHQYLTKTCTTTAIPSRFLFIDSDAEMIAVTASVAGPPCLQHMSSDPVFGFYATYGPANAIRLGKFDDHGDRIAEAIVVSRPHTATTTEDISTAVLADEARVYVLVANFESFDFGGQLVVFDKNDLRELARITSFGTTILRRPVALTRFRDRLAIADPSAQSVVTLSVPDLGSPTSIALNSPPLSSDAAGPMTWDAREELLFTSTPGGLGGEIWLVPPRPGEAPLEHRAYYQEAINPWSSVIDGEYLMIGAHREDVETKALMLEMDRATRRYTPRRFTIGHGIVVDMTRDERGHIWALMPWDDLVIRVDDVRR